MHSRFWSTGLVSLLMSVGFASAQSPLVSHLVYQYGGPQTRTQCVSTRVVSDNVITGKVVLCDGWSTDLQQHALFLDWYAPNVQNANDQTKAIADSCLQIGIAEAIGAAVLAPPTVLTFLTGKIDTVKAGVISCVEANKALGKIFVKDFDIRTRQSDFW